MKQHNEVSTPNETQIEIQNGNDSKEQIKNNESLTEEIIIIDE